MTQRDLFGFDNQLRRLSDLGDQLEVLNEVIDFEAFRPGLVMALRRSDRSKGGRPPYDAVMMFRILIIQALNDLSDDRVEFLINDRLSFMRFLGIGLGGRVPDARTIWLYRDVLTRAGAIDALFDRLNAIIKEKGYLAIGGQIVDASIISAPKQRMTDEEKTQAKAGKPATEIWDKPAKARQKDTDARWSIKYSRARAKPDGSVSKGHVDIAIPSFGYKSHISADRKHGFIRKWKVTDAARHDGKILREGLIDQNNTASDVWADTAYRSKANEKYLKDHDKVSHIHQRKPKGKPMHKRIRKANSRKSIIRARIEHVFGEQKNRMGLFIRSIGIDRARTRIGMVNIAFNMRRLVYHERRATA